MRFRTSDVFNILRNYPWLLSSATILDYYSYFALKFGVSLTLPSSLYSSGSFSRFLRADRTLSAVGQDQLAQRTSTKGDYSDWGSIGPEGGRWSRSKFKVKIKVTCQSQWLYWKDMPWIQERALIGKIRKGYEEEDCYIKLLLKFNRGTETKKEKRTADEFMNLWLMKRL